ncbi:hypothetical protein [Pseudalkalibacillus sp. SCS-8]
MKKVKGLLVVAAVAVAVLVGATDSNSTQLEASERGVVSDVVINGA